MSTKDAAAVKALEELGLRKTPTSDTLPDQLSDLQAQLDSYEEEFGKLTPERLQKYLVNRNIS